MDPVADRGAVSDPTRMTRRRWYLMTGGWALTILPWGVSAATSDHPVGARVLLVLALLAYLGCYVEGLYRAMQLRNALFSAAVLAVMAGLWVTVVLVLGDDGGILYTVSFLLAAVLCLVTPRRFAVALVLLTAAAGIGLSWWIGGRLDPDELIGMVAMSLAMIGMFRIIWINSELREAREELAVLAVISERERMARDLHDVLGHSLTTITVKAGLARRLLERGDLARATDEVGDVERLGRQALAEVRSTVAANRVASLARELAGAREALRASEIEAVLPGAVDDVPADRQQAFAYVVREGVTNVIRHSGASRCTVRLTPSSVEVLDDGFGCRSGPGGATGHGLSGLTERLAAIGGRVEAGPAPAGGYRLRAECEPA